MVGVAYSYHYNANRYNMSIMNDDILFRMLYMTLHGSRRVCSCTEFLIRRVHVCVCVCVRACVCMHAPNLHAPNLHAHTVCSVRYQQTKVC